VLKIDPENRRVSLGIKQVNAHLGRTGSNNTRSGKSLRARFAHRTFCAFRRLGENIEASATTPEIE